MTIEPPQPPTAPAPAVRPTPPAPPRIDKAPFVKESADDAPQANHTVDTPETQARDAVAHGSGALTKRTVNNGDESPQPQTATPSSRQEPVAPLDTQSDYDRGQDVLREFKNLDAPQTSRTSDNFPANTSTQSPPPVPKLHYDEGHGIIYWLCTLIIVAVATFVIAKNFLFTDKPALTKSELFDDTKKATPIKKPTPPKPPEDGKRKRFEVRV